MSELGKHSSEQNGNDGHERGRLSTRRQIAKMNYHNTIIDSNSFISLMRQYAGTPVSYVELNVAVRA
jgi:hypothetical protein